MNESAPVRPQMPRWILPVLVVAIVIVLFQALFVLTAGEARILSLGRAAAKAERDVKGASSYFNGRSNEEIEKLFADRRTDVVQAFRKSSWKPAAVKVGLAVLLGFIAFGVRERKPKPTRVLALIAGILLGFSMIIAFTGLGKFLGTLYYADSKLYVALDIVWFAVAILSTAACFVAFAKMKPLPAPATEPDAVETPAPPAS